MTEVVLDGVNKVYPDGFHAVRDVSLRVPDGELFVLLGPSGCGKSTILRMVAGLEEITSGTLFLGGRRANELAPRERDLAMVFQNGALYPHRDVRGNIAFPLEISGDDSPAAHERIVELSRALGIDETLNRLPSTLSGGQRQRVAMGRALIREPGIFLMDEPLSNLDAGLRTELRMEISALVRSLGVTTLYVTHDQTEALTLADRVAIMRRGVLQDVGTPQQVYDDPATVFVAAFLSTPPINLVRASVWADQDMGVILGLGGRRVCLPWSDPRSSALVSHHGAYITAGIRADALQPAGESAAGPEGTVSGRVRTLEFHGPEWLAYVETDIPHVDAESHDDESAKHARHGSGYGDASSETGNGDRAPATAGSGRHETAGRDRTGPGIVRRVLRSAGIIADEGPAERVPHGGTHRRADLVVRLGARSGVRAGDTIELTVDVERVLLFGDDGHRIDPVRR